MSDYDVDREVQRSRLGQLRHQRQMLIEEILATPASERNCEWMLPRIGNFYRSYKSAYICCSHEDIRRDLSMQVTLVLGRISQLGNPHRGRVAIFKRFLLDHETVLFATTDGVIIKREPPDADSIVIAHCGYDNLLDAILSVHEMEEEMAVMDAWAKAKA
ncbi:MAG: hypothetical protein AB7F35_05485 [Acetobacteraceae bacterium]